MESLAAQERRKWLLDELSTARTISLADAAGALGVSEMTVRRDLRRMEAEGQARRVRGGAVFNGPVSFHGREKSHPEEKQRIAEKLLPLVPDSGVIAMDSSTTMHRLALGLRSRQGLTVVTNGMLTFQALQDRPGVTAILTGGAADKRSDSLVGPVATAFLNDMRFATFFTSAAAIDEYAGYEDTLEEAEIKRAFARSSARLILGAHTQKLDQNATAAALRLGRIDTLATELDPETPELARYREIIREVL